MHDQIDWSRGYGVARQGVSADRARGRGRAALCHTLVKVWTKEGVEIWVLIHVEVQTTRDADFPLRIFVYNFRGQNHLPYPYHLLANRQIRRQNQQPTNEL